MLLSLLSLVYSPACGLRALTALLPSQWSAAALGPASTASAVAAGTLSGTAAAGETMFVTSTNGGPSAAAAGMLLRACRPSGSEVDGPGAGEKRCRRCPTTCAAPVPPPVAHEAPEPGAQLPARAAVGGRRWAAEAEPASASEAGWTASAAVGADLPPGCCCMLRALKVLWAGGRALRRGLAAEPAADVVLPALDAPLT